MIYCFYHSVDLDGKASGAIVKKKFPEAELIPFNYNNVLPIEKIKKDDIVYFVDVVPQPYEDLIKIYEIVEDNLFVIDHHQSFMKSAACEWLVNKIPKNIYCSSLYAGCELTWMYLFDTQIPKAVHLLGQYDSWRNKNQDGDYDWDKEVLPFQYGMRLKEFDFTTFQMFLQEEVIADGTAEKAIQLITRDGEVVLNYQKVQNKVTMKGSFDATIEGYKCLVVNSVLKNSQVFESKWDEKKYDLMIAFSLVKNQWNYSFYTDKKGIDVSLLAKKFGGGGHVKAAGCYTDKFIFHVKGIM